MTPRSLRRAAERRALKAAKKQARPGLSPESLSQSGNETPQPISEQQLQANRANAQWSTGPTTPEGKAISARNHTTHGLTIQVDRLTTPFQVLPGEDQADFDSGLALFRAEWKPVTATEHSLVDRLAIHTWLTRRAHRLINEILLRSNGDPTPQDLRQFEVFSRYQTTHQRAFNKAFADLMRLRNFQLREANQRQQLEQKAVEAQAKEQNRFESQKRSAAKHELQMQILQLKLETQKARTERTLHPKKAAQPLQTMAA